ncbi:serine/threonine-protein kinase [Rubrivirga marina]|uniref:Protein kinase domain-containing protein n=1 Tax=Rubrivirga marina TaxID=1196024 RepID=A0A271J3W8_9BACT|nr:serine/threonine-protein kinase [Rubrivirga marina]PAP77978.1 hypothetical protein BSZ37_16795 [Rubrivirga marina]
MTPHDWETVGRLFHEAASLPLPDRSPYLDEACAPGLRGEVERLLAAEPPAEAYFDPPTGLAALLPTAELREVVARERDDDLPAGARVGPWEIVEELGRGGMGAVYRARRADAQYEQTVALKVVKRGMDTDALLARFRRERAVLASLEHPGIARLVDGGAAPDGRPYLALELVDGEPITRWADRHRLGVEARLQLFLQVCEAVAHAHRRLVVHRDLKPSNVLVDPEGRARLLDFGLAAVLSDDASEAGERSIGGPRLLTPEYAAPEQFEGGPTTTATDVYTLGVLLYELLTGRRPHGTTRRRLPMGATPTARPARPSAAATRPQERDDAPEAEALAALRATTPARLRHRLRGDLDAIALTALQAEPERRYASVDALADDVRRHLAARPVAARPDRLAYRAWAFARRNRARLAAAALALAVAATLGGQALLQQRAAASERERADLASAFVLGLLTESDPREGAGGTTPVRDVLARAERRAEAELAGRPDLLARVLTTVGGTLTELEEYDRAGPLLRRALALAEATGDAPAAAEAHIRLAGRARRQNRYEAAAAHARQAAATALPRGDAAAVLHARALGEQAAVAADRGAFDAAARDYRTALDLLRGASRAERHTARLLSQLGGVLSDVGDLDGSARVLREAAALQRELVGPSHPDLAFTYVSLGNTLELRDSLAASVAAHREALGVLQRAYGEDHWATATALHNLASAEDAAGRDALAAQLYDRALAIKRRLYGDTHGSVAATLINLGYLQYEQGAVVDAEATTREALRVARAIYGDAHFRTALAAYNLAEILLGQRRALDEAERLAAEALVVDRATYGPDDEGTLLTALLLGRVQAARGACGRAVPTLRAALGAIDGRLRDAPERRAAAADLAACEG